MRAGWFRSGGWLELVQSCDEHVFERRADLPHAGHGQVGLRKNRRETICRPGVRASHQHVRTLAEHLHVGHAGDLPEHVRPAAPFGCNRSNVILPRAGVAGGRRERSGQPADGLQKISLNKMTSTKMA